MAGVVAGCGSNPSCIACTQKNAICSTLAALDFCSVSSGCRSSTNTFFRFSCKGLRRRLLNLELTQFCGIEVKRF